MSTGMPALSVTLNVTVGRVARRRFVHLHDLRHEAGQRLGVRGNHVRAGDGCVEVHRGLRRCGKFLHWLSFGCGRLTWFAPVAKFTSSWQEPHAAALDWSSSCRLGRALGMAGGAVPNVLRKDDLREVRPGAAMPDPVRRSGLDARQARSHVDLVDQYLHILGQLRIRVDGLRVWHMMQSSTFMRDPPWPNSGLWHWLQASVVTTERVTFTGEPFGTKLKTSLAVSLHSSNVPNSDRLR